MRTSLASLVDDFRSYGNEIAVVRYQGVRRKVTTYGALAALSGRVAALLAHRGIVAGDRVLIWGENSAEWMAAFFGCMLRGVLAVPLDAAGTSDFAARVATDVNPSLAFGDAELVNQLPQGVPRIAFEDWQATLPATPAVAIDGLNESTPLEILFTSGTTGDPKGIVLTHGNVLASFTPIENASLPYLRYERFVHPIRILHTLPLSHVFGQTMGLWVPSIYRAQLHFENRLIASRLIETIKRERISVLAAVPRVYALMKNYLESELPGLADRIAALNATSSASKTKSLAKAIAAAQKWWRFRDVHSRFGLKFWALISGGGALPQQIERFWNAVGLVVVQGYGMTESTALITLNHPFHVASGSIGKPLAGREVKLGPDGEVLVRGASISQATWSRGRFHTRASEWLATGDIAEAQPSGELRFIGRKSEVIVTAAGVNIHPEDLEAAIEHEAGVTACAVVSVDMADGPEPLAVLVLNAQAPAPATIIESANRSLAEYQRMSRWMVWPEPDLPRTSTGKVRRKEVAARIATLQPELVLSGGATQRSSFENNVAESRTDWLLATIAQITGESFNITSDSSRLTEDLHLDSLGRMQLAAAIEERFGVIPGGDSVDQAQTIGDLRELVNPVASESQGSARTLAIVDFGEVEAPNVSVPSHDSNSDIHASEPVTAEERKLPEHRYLHWPWSRPIAWIRNAFLELVTRPMLRALANPRYEVTGAAPAKEPMLIVANHVTAFDVPLIESALPASIRHRLAVAMSGEMLRDFRTFRNPDVEGSQQRVFILGPLFYYLLTALFNVFPLPKQRDIHRSFAHAGEALDRGMNVLVFPEGRRSSNGELAAFRPGIGMLAKQAFTPVLPVAICGLGDLKTGKRSWFRSGAIEVRVGMPMRFSATATEAEIAEQLHAAVEQLLA